MPRSLHEEFQTWFKSRYVNFGDRRQYNIIYVRHYHFGKVALDLAQ